MMKTINLPEKVWQYDLSHGGNIAAAVAEDGSVYVSFEHPIPEEATNEQLQTLALITSYTREDGVRLSHFDYFISKEAATMLVELLQFVLKRPA